MAGRIKQYPPPGVGLIRQRGPERYRSLHSRPEIVCGEVEVHDRRSRPDRRGVTVDLLRYQHSPVHLDSDTGFLRPQLATSKQRPVEVGELLRVGTVQGDGYKPYRAELGHSGTLRPLTHVLALGHPDLPLRRHGARRRRRHARYLYSSTRATATWRSPFRLVRVRVVGARRG